MSLLIIQANQFPVPGLLHWSPILNTWAFWSFRPISSQVPGLSHWSPVLTVSFFSSFSFLSPTFRAFLISCFRDLFLLYSFITLMGWSLEILFSAQIPHLLSYPLRQLCSSSSSSDPKLLHAPGSAYIFVNNGRILMFKVSKRLYRSARHDEIIFRWCHNPPGGENLN